jgi:hypothetical protein
MDGFSWNLILRIFLLEPYISLICATQTTADTTSPLQKFQSRGINMHKPQVGVCLHGRPSLWPNNKYWLFSLLTDPPPPRPQRRLSTFGECYAKPSTFLHITATFQPTSFTALNLVKSTSKAIKYSYGLYWCLNAVIWRPVVEEKLHVSYPRHQKEVSDQLHILVASPQWYKCLVLEVPCVTVIVIHRPQLSGDIPADASCLCDKTVAHDVSIKEVHCTPAFGLEWGRTSLAHSLLHYPGCCSQEAGIERQAEKSSIDTNQNIYSNVVYGSLHKAWTSMSLRKDSSNSKLNYNMFDMSAEGFFLTIEGRAKFEHFSWTYPLFWDTTPRHWVFGPPCF